MPLRPWERVPNCWAYYKTFFRQLGADAFHYFWSQIVTAAVLGVMASQKPFCLLSETPRMFAHVCARADCRSLRLRYDYAATQCRLEPLGVIAR